MTGHDRGPSGRVGVVGVWSARWSPDLRGGYDAPDEARRVCELEDAGVRAFWFPGRAGGDVFGACAAILGATENAVVATGILNIWMHDPSEVARDHADVVARHGDRLLLGLGVSHAHVVERSGRSYERPFASMVAYLDALDRAEPPLGRAHRVLAALGPRMLDLAASRSAGAHPYLTTPAHTSAARARLGPEPLLAPHLKVIAADDADTARGLARSHLVPYLQMPNYSNNLLRCGFVLDDLADGGSDALIDALFAWGPPEQVAAHIDAHLVAGADHVAVQVVTDDPDLEHDRLLAVASLAAAHDT